MGRKKDTGTVGDVNGERRNRETTRLFEDMGTTRRMLHYIACSLHCSHWVIHHGSHKCTHQGDVHCVSILQRCTKETMIGVERYLSLARESLAKYGNR